MRANLTHAKELKDKIETQCPLTGTVFWLFCQNSILFCKLLKITVMCMYLNLLKTDFYQFFKKEKKKGRSKGMKDIEC